MLLPLSQIGSYVPEEIGGVGVEDRRGRRVASVTLKDHTGREINTADLFDGKRPVVIVPMYYTCPVVCSTTLTLTLEALLRIGDLVPGKDYTLFVYSFDHRDDVLRAAEKCRTVERYLGKGVGRCAVGDSVSVWELSSSIGMLYKRIKGGLFSHPVAVIVATPDGRVSRAVYDVGGINPMDLRLAVLEAADGKVGRNTVVNKFLLYCYRYDSANRRYELVVWRIVKLFGVLSIALLGGIYAYIFVAKRKRE